MGQPWPAKSKNLEAMPPAEMRAWSHVAIPRSVDTQHPEERVSWWVGLRTDAAIDSASFWPGAYAKEECLVPTVAAAVSLLPVSARAIAIDDLAVSYFKALRQLDIFPIPSQCKAKTQNAAARFFCTHA